MEIFDRQQAFFGTGKTWPLSHRLEGLSLLEKMIRENRDDILKALEHDLGKSSLDADIGEISFLLGEILRARKHLKSWMRPRRIKTPMILKPAKSTLLPCPLGVVLIISPWNYPFRLAIAPLVGALAAGNCAILKLSPTASHSEKLIKELISRYFPVHWVKVLEGGIPQVQQLLTRPLGHVFFTGGQGAAREIAQTCGKNLIPYTLELGGQNPAVIHEDADLKVSAKRLIQGKFFNNSQTCVAPNVCLRP